MGETIALFVREKRVEVTLDPVTYEALEKIARAVGVPIETIHRELIRPFAQYVWYYMAQVIHSCWHFSEPIKKLRVNGTIGSTLETITELAEIISKYEKYPVELTIDKDISKKHAKTLCDMKLAICEREKVILDKVREVYSGFKRCANVLKMFFRL